MAAVTSYIGLGSNLDNPVEQILLACQALSQLSDTRVVVCSSLYESLPLTLSGMNLEVQPKFINAVVELETRLAPLLLLDSLHAIEQQQGRDRSGPRWGARTIDLDILLFGHKIIDLPQLQVPHPGLADREFVLYPLYEIAPQLVLPDGAQLESLYENCPRRELRQLHAAELV